MNKVKVELNQKGVRTQILQAPWMSDYIKSEAEKQGEGIVKSYIGFDRARAVVFPDEKVETDDRKNNT